MNRFDLYNLSRGVASVLGFIQFVGVVWFSGTVPFIVFCAGLIAGVGSILVAFVSPRLLTGTGARFSLIAIGVAAASAAGVLLSIDLTRDSGVEWDVIALNVTQIVALWTLVGTTLLRPPANDPKSS